MSTERGYACYTNSINLSTFTPVNFHYRLQKKKWRESNPCTGPQGSRRLRLPDFQTIRTWRCQQIRLAELKCSSLQRRYLTTKHSTWNVSHKSRIACAEMLHRITVHY